LESKLYVGNLSYNVTEDQLRESFSQAGAIKQVALIKDRDTRRPKGFGFVEMTTEVEAQKAIEMFNEHELDGPIVVVAGYFYFFQLSRSTTVIPISQLGRDVQLGTVKSISVNGPTLNIKYRDGASATWFSGTIDGSLEKTLNDLSVSPDRILAVDITYDKSSQWSDALTILVGFLPLVFVGALLFFLMRRAQGGNNQAMSFGKSRARAFSADKPTIPFADVAGVDEAKRELQEVVEFLKEPDKFTSLGARTPRGVLLVGPPGTGKTLMARAVTGEANVPFFASRNRIFASSDTS